MRDRLPTVVHHHNCQQQVDQDLNKVEEVLMKEETDLIKESKDQVLEEAILIDGNNEELTKDEIKVMLSCAICSDICKRGITVRCCNRQNKQSFHLFS